MAQYWTNWVTAVNPQLNLQQIGKNPAGMAITKRSNTKLHVTECITRYQRHGNCTPSYCLRKVKDSEDMRCRFHFPIPHRLVVEVTREQTFGGTLWEARGKKEMYLSTISDKRLPHKS